MVGCELKRGEELKLFKIQLAAEHVTFQRGFVVSIFTVHFINNTKTAHNNFNSFLFWTVLLLLFSFHFLSYFYNPSTITSFTFSFKVNPIWIGFNVCFSFFSLEKRLRGSKHIDMVGLRVRRS